MSGALGTEQIFRLIPTSGTLTSSISTPLDLAAERLRWFGEVAVDSVWSIAAVGVLAMTAVELIKDRTQWKARIFWRSLRATLIRGALESFVEDGARPPPPGFLGQLRLFYRPRPTEAERRGLEVVLALLENLRDAEGNPVEARLAEPTDWPSEAIMKALVQVACPGDLLTCLDGKAEETERFLRAAYREMLRYPTASAAYPLLLAVLSGRGRTHDVVEVLKEGERADAARERLQGSMERRLSVHLGVAERASGKSLTFLSVFVSALIFLVVLYDPDAISQGFWSSTKNAALWLLISILGGILAPSAHDIGNALRRLRKP